jgi:hypothetical protein
LQRSRKGLGDKKPGAARSGAEKSLAAWKEELANTTGPKRTRQPTWPALMDKRFADFTKQDWSDACSQAKNMLQNIKRKEDAARGKPRERKKKKEVQDDVEEPSQVQDQEPPGQAERWWTEFTWRRESQPSLYQNRETHWLIQNDPFAEDNKEEEPLDPETYNPERYGWVKVIEEAPLQLPDEPPQEEDLRVLVEQLRNENKRLRERVEELENAAKRQKGIDPGRQAPTPKRIFRSGQ